MLVSMSCLFYGGGGGKYPTWGGGGAVRGGGVVGEERNEIGNTLEETNAFLVCLTLFHHSPSSICKSRLYLIYREKKDYKLRDR
jgi:hypothetical protein